MLQEFKTYKDKTMDTKKELSKIKKPKSKDFELHSIENVNHKPHPYCITPKHLSSDRMYLDNETIKEAEKQGARCGMYYNPDNPNQCRNSWKKGFVRCDLSFEEHTSDKLLFIKALVDKDIKDLSGLQSYLVSIKKQLKAMKIDGVAFVKK